MTPKVATAEHWMHHHKRGERPRHLKAAVRSNQADTASYALAERLHRLHRPSQTRAADAMESFA